MNSVKQRRIAIPGKLYDNSTLWHPDNRCDKLAELIISSGDIIAQSAVPMAKAKKICSPEMAGCLVSLQSLLEKLLNTFGLIICSLPDLTAEPDLLAQAIESVSPSSKGGVQRQTAEDFLASLGGTTQEGLCIQATQLVVAVIKKVLYRMSQTLAKLQGKQDLGLENQLRIYMSQLTALAEYALPSAMSADPNDIFYKDKDDPEWVKLKDYYSVYDTTSSSFEESYKAWEDGVKAVEASCRYSLKKEGDFSTFLSTGLNLLYYSIFSRKAQQQGELLFVEADSSFISKFWNITEGNRYLKYMYGRSLPPIKIHHVIYAPKMLVPLTPQDLADKRMQKLPDIDPQFLLRRKPFDPAKHVKIRIMGETRLPVDPEDRRRGDSRDGVSFGKSTIKTVLVQLHGGGFVASTSYGHQHYVRKWAKMIPDSVIMSIDYRLAPEFPYPAALDDIWQGYYWIITQGLSQLRIKAKTIIVIGDSAGGNFAMGLVLRCIHTGLRLPDGLLLGYPALNLSMKSFTPSLLISVDDYALRFSLLLACTSCYVQGGDPATDPYISPALINDDDLSKFPPMRLIVSGRDPLRDESYRLLHRLVTMKKDVYLKEYRKFPHGLWSFASSYGIEECKYAVSDAAAWLKELIAKHQEKLLEESGLLPDTADVLRLTSI